MIMDSRNPPQVPFYLFDLCKPDPAQPVPLATQLDTICKDLRGELKKLPRKKKQYSLEYFLGGNYGVDEDIRHLQLASKTLGSKDDPCSLTHIVGKMKTCCFSKQLMPLTTSQLKGFQLQGLPEETQLFPPGVTGEKDLLDYENKEKETEKTKKEEIDKGNVKPFPTNDQRLGAPVSAEILVTSKTVVPVKSSLISVHHYQSNGNNPSSIAKKSVAAALKGMRNRFGKAKGRGIPTNRGLQNIAKVYIPSTRRGRGRPRKNVIVDQGFVKRSPTLSPPPSPEISTSSSSSSLSTPTSLSDGIQYGIIELCDLKMRLKIDRPKNSIPKVPPPSSLSTSPASLTGSISRSERPKLILKIQLCRLRGAQEENQSSKHSSEEEEQSKYSSEDEDDKCLDLY